MAISINVIGSYDDKDIKRAQRDLEKLGKVAGNQGKSITESMDRLGDGMIKAGGALTKSVTLPVVGAGAAMFAAFTRQEDAVARMNGALKANGGQAGVTAEHIQDLAKSLQETTTFGDEATISAAGLLLTFHKVRNEVGEGNNVFDRTLTTAQDLSAALGIDLESATMQLAKALENPTKGMGALGRSGTTFTQQQKDMIKAMEDSGDVLGAQKMILEVVESQYAGMAEEMANTSSGKMKQAFNALGDTFEEFGEIIADVVNKVSGFLQRLAERFQNLSPRTKELIVQIAAAAAAIGPLLLIGGKLIKTVSGIIKVVKVFNLTLMANPVFLIVAALVALGAALFIAYQRVEGFREVVDKAFDIIKQVIGFAWENVIKPIFEAIVEAVKEHLMPVIKDLVARFQEAWPGIQSAMETAWGVIQPILEFLIKLFVKIYSEYLKILIRVWSTVFKAIVKALQIAWNVISTIFNAVWGFIRDKLVPIFQTIGSVAATIWSGISSAISFAWNIVSGIFNAIWGVITNTLVPIFERIGSVIATVWAGIADAIGFAWGIISGIFEGIKGGFQSVIDFFTGAADTIGGIFSGIGGAIQSAFQTAFDFVRNAWNNTLGGKGFSIPDLPGIPGRGQRIEFPTFHDGGLVPGQRGQEMLALLEAGELVIPASQVSQMSSQPQQAPVSNTYNITINGMVGKDKREILDYLARELPRAAVKSTRSYA